MAIARTLDELLIHIKNSVFIDPETGCHNWIRNKDKDGYGKVFFQKKHWRAHRLVFDQLSENISSKDLICHHCDNPSCVNIEHLFKGTPKTNMSDKVKKGRLKNQNMSKTHCNKGHEFTPDNIVWHKTQIGNPKRTCRTCYIEYYTIRHKIKKACGS